MFLFLNLMFLFLNLMFLFFQAPILSLIFGVVLLCLYIYIYIYIYAYVVLFCCVFLCVLCSCVFFFPAARADPHIQKRT